MALQEREPQSPWPRCPDADRYCLALFQEFIAKNQAIATIAHRFREEAGVRLSDLIDHWVIPAVHVREAELASIGFTRSISVDGDEFWEHTNARLPRIRLDGDICSSRMAIAVEDICAFAENNDLPAIGQLGDPDSGYEEARYPQDAGELAIVTRRGYCGFRPGLLTASDARTLRRVREKLRSRVRRSTGAEAASEVACLLASLMESVEQDRLVDEFFAAERSYYMTRNRAARWQYARQEAIGIGWANHDHHTYRSSRAGFRGLINLWLLLGFEARERFYAGAEAGWGAQILEHPVSRVVLFCDADMAPDEIEIDYSAEDLPPLPSLGTIGLWCELHTESIAVAGLHHLEAEFEFAEVSRQLMKAGIGVMPPFTDLPTLKQAFTDAEPWPVETIRLQNLFDRGLITAEQRERFEQKAAPGSHLEILQRWEGFKGFNKTGIDAIIRSTDARLTR